MILTKRKLKGIVEEELTGLIREDKKNWKVLKKIKKKKSDRKKKDEVFPGHEELTQLANGITEFNDSHDSDGLFSAEEDESCESSYFIDGKRKRKSGSLTDKDDTGRGKKKNSGKGSRKCKDDNKNWEQLFKEFYSAYNVDAPEETEVYDEDEEQKIAFDRITGEAIEVEHGEPDEMYDCAKQRQADQMIIKKLKAGIKQMKTSGQKQCGLSYDDAVRIVNTLELATKGKAFGDSG